MGGYFGLRGIVPVSGLLLAGSMVLVNAATTTTSFTSQIIIQNSCNIIAATNLDFGIHGVLATNVDSASVLLVNCTSGSSFDVGLNEGTTPGGTTATRKMDSGSDTIDYTLSQDGGHTTNWGNTVGTDTLSATGTGTLQAIAIFARVPAQATPAAGTYTDTVTVTVTF
ncbi:MAG: spore coat U domain-containing protein [Rhizobiaceae bacterium]|nr:spore coat U domain-containing protein [Rhizobiaceae bacterium]